MSAHNGHGPHPIRLGDDGEFYATIACKSCGYISASDNDQCEQCGLPFPQPPSLLRLRLEQLRRSDQKKNESSHSTFGLGKLSLFVTILLAVMFVITLAAYLIPRIAPIR